MKKLLGGIALSVLLAAPAMAADIRMPVKAPPPAVAAAVYNWTGFYIGGHAGWQNTAFDGLVTNFTGGGAAPPGQHWDVDAKSGIFGGLIGIRYQFQNLVLGVEANLSGGMAGGHSTSPSSDCVSAVANRECHAALKNLFTIGPQLGWAHGNMLLYVTGGYAQGSIRSELHTATGTPLIRSKSKHDGWFLGAGVEWAPWLKNVVVGLEYQRVLLGDEDHPFVNFGNGVAGGERATFKSVTDIIRARLTLPIPSHTDGFAQ